MPRYTNLAAPSPAVFPDSYADARVFWQRHLLNLQQPATMRSFKVAQAAPDGTPLTTDSAWIGARDAAQVLVVIGGTHGIEGFAGTAVICDLLAGLAHDQPPDGLAMLCVHALNPWGYAWHRRCDADGVDLNRNCVDFGRPLPRNPGYGELRAALFDPDRERRQQAFQAYIDTHGQTAFEIAVSGGQYQDPAGPFYGGCRPAHGRRVVEALIADYRLGERRLGVIDVHTGLGEWGNGEIICDHPPGSDGAATAQCWYGERCTLPALGTSSSVPKTGLLDYAWHAVMPAGSCYVTLEFGTSATAELFDVLLQDHRFWAKHGPAAARHPGHADLVMRMRAHFCPDDPEWRSRVRQQASLAIRQAITGLLA